MSYENLSSAQQSSLDASKDVPDAPMSYSSNTSSSAAQATAWRTRSLGGGKPLAWSRKTGGTTFNWDDSSQTNLPSSDKGAGRSQ